MTRKVIYFRRIFMIKVELNNNEKSEFYISISKTRKENAPLKGRGYSMKKFHKHNHYEIMNIYSANNNVILYVDNKKYTIGPNSCILIPPNIEHYTERNLHSDRLILNLSREYARTIFNFLKIDIADFFSSNVLVCSSAQIDELYSIAEEILFEMNKCGNEKATGTIRLLTARIVDILNHHSSKPEPYFYPIQDLQISSVINYLKTNYAQRITLDYISEQFMINKFSLCKKFKRETDLSVIDFLTQIRINHARDFLENSALSITKIASATGFDSSSYFSRAFKKRIGISPAEYRKQYSAKVK